MKKTILTPALLALAVITPLSASAEAEKATTAQVKEATTDTAPQTITTEAASPESRTIDSRQEMRASMEEMQEQAFQQYIESLKNHPAAKQLPADVQERRSAMIQRMQDQHAVMIKMRKQRQQEFEERRNKRMQELKKI